MKNPNLLLQNIGLQSDKDIQPNERVYFKQKTKNKTKCYMIHNLVEDKYKSLLAP